MPNNLAFSPNPASAKNYVIFADAPYLLQTLTLSIVASAKSFSALPLGVSVPLVMGVDYFPAFLYNDATGELGQPVYGGLCFVDPQLAGELSYDFTQVGHGEFSATTTQINGIYANSTIDPLVSWWEAAVSGLPSFPSNALPYNATTPVTVTDVDSAISAIVPEAAASVTAKSIFDFTAHIANQNNPHNDTADAVQLGSVPNWAVGSAATVIAGGSTTEFATPLAVKDSVAIVVPSASVARPGLVQLNQGTQAGDPTNATDGLTAAGLVYMLENNLLESGVTLVDNQRQKVVFSPYPIVYPATWNGVVCNNFEALVQAVQDATGIHELTANAADGSIYFPRTAATPSLALA